MKDLQEPSGTKGKGKAKKDKDDCDNGKFENPSNTINIIFGGTPELQGLFLILISKEGKRGCEHLEHAHGRRVAVVQAAACTPANSVMCEDTCAKFADSVIDSMAFDTETLIKQSIEVPTSISTAQNVWFGGTRDGTVHKWEYAAKMRDDPVRPKRADRVIPLRAPSALSFSVRETGAGASSSPAGRGPPAARPCPGSATWPGAGGASGRPGKRVQPAGRAPPMPRPVPTASGDLRRRVLGRAETFGGAAWGERGRRGLGGRELRRGRRGLGGRELRRGRAGAARPGVAGSSGGGGNRLAGGGWGDGSGWRR
uniref:Uncharacterized protein n=1 Tax=Setaria viridis TaxID=4556 RepID=A0A4U6VHH6_SETVI|nr:hypothetical protein SEVIR_3G370000v2 [Setaria viridis]